MRFARRLDAVPPYLFAELERQIEAKRRAGVDVIRLGIGDPDLPTPAPVIAALADAARDPATHQYPTNHGSDEFRAAAMKQAAALGPMDDATWNRVHDEFVSRVGPAAGRALAKGNAAPLPGKTPTKNWPTRKGNTAPSLPPSVQSCRRDRPRLIRVLRPSA